MNKKTDNGNEPLTLKTLIQYNEQVLLPAIERNLDKRFDQMQQSTDKQFKEIKEILGELRDGQAMLIESQTNLVSVVRKQQDALHDHDVRITRLEKSSPSLV